MGQCSSAASMFYLAGHQKFSWFWESLDQQQGRGKLLWTAPGERVWLSLLEDVVRRETNPKKRYVHCLSSSTSHWPTCQSICTCFQDKSPPPTAPLLAMWAKTRLLRHSLHGPYQVVWVDFAMRKRWCVGLSTRGEFSLELRRLRSLGPGAQRLHAEVKFYLTFPY